MFVNDAVSLGYWNNRKTFHTGNIKLAFVLYETNGVSSCHYNERLLYHRGKASLLNGSACVSLGHNGVVLMVTHGETASGFTKIHKV